jgi:alkanesulfonate monooxygenase SsuD/methylene tetrahydromethanopterin reductase-like flavin-dependent oxidoreductase (luciferase family)
MFLMRFGMRAATTDPGARADLYRAALDMVEWAETRGCLSAVVSQHHASDDGYLPSPVPMAAAMAARTSTLPIIIGALLLALYEPVKVAEDLAVLDHLSRGRVSAVIGIGYRPEEFAMFGVDPRRRAAITEDRIHILRRLWLGEEVDVDGRAAIVRPLPFTPGGPPLAYGGGSEAAARRAGRLGMAFLAEKAMPELESVYRQAAQEAGVDAPGCIMPEAGVPLTVFVADDPDRAWAELGQYLLVDAVGYGRWFAGRELSASVSRATTVEELRAEQGDYRIVTPEVAAQYVARGVPLGLQPLVGGVPPDVAWPYLEAAVAAVGSQPA